MYKKTGRNISVSVDNLKNAIINKLHTYDNSSPHIRKNMSNPYRDVIYTQLENGKIIQIPSDIQEATIYEWKHSKQEVDKQYDETEEINVYHNELDKLRQQEQQKHRESTIIRNSLPEMPRDYELHNIRYSNNDYIDNVHGIDESNQKNATRNFQEPDNIRYYTENNTTECLTCNTNNANKYTKYSTQSLTSPYVENSNYNNNNNDDDDDDYYYDDDEYNIRFNGNIYKYLFFLVLLILLFILYKARANRQEIFNL